MYPSLFIGLTVFLGHEFQIDGCVWSSQNWKILSFFVYVCLFFCFSIYNSVSCCFLDSTYIWEVTVPLLPNRANIQPFASLIVWIFERIHFQFVCSLIKLLVHLRYFTWFSRFNSNTSSPEKKLCFHERTG